MTKTKSKNSLEFEEKYTYNRADDVYVVNVKNRVKPLVLKGFKIRAIRRAISSGISPSETSAAVCLKYRISEPDLVELKKIFDMTRDSFPLTKEELEENSIEGCAETILQEKQSLIAQIVEKQSWKDTQSDANKWREFVINKLDPIAGALDNWTPPKAAPLHLNRSRKTVTKNTLVIGLSDIHWGSYANARYMYNDKGGWDSNKTTQVVDAYCQGILQSVSERTYKFKKVALCFLGDFLHSQSGKTSRGTELKFDIIREEVFEMALSGLCRFVSNILENFEDVEVHSVVGNHFNEGDAALYRAVEAYFRTNKGIKFFNYTTRPASFRLENTLFLMDHGQDSGERAYVPLADNKLENHVQSLLLQKPDNLLGINSRLFLIGDRHKFKNVEYADFELIMFGTTILADEHGAVNNWNNRARQSCLEIDENGLKGILHFYIDSLI